jgi:predicted membrane chloride channel (bestrophin family)
MDLQLSVPRTQKHIILLEWVLFKCREARKRGILEGDSGLEHMLLDKMCALRSACSQVAHKTNGRMPLAYAHIVQVLVDSFLFFAPLAQYADLGIFSVISVGILTIFYSGLLDLAKVFLDPLDNEDYHEGCVYMDLNVFIRESNAASQRWKNAGQKLKW